MPVIQKIRRTRPAPVVELAPTRIRRVRAVEVKDTGTVARVRRVRRPVETDFRPIFEIDWNRSLGYKLQIYMVTSYLYYELSRSLITDHDFDRLCRELAAGWDDFEHQHKSCTDKASMEAATGYANKYPLMVQGAAEHMFRNFRER